MYTWLGSLGAILIGVVVGGSGLVIFMVDNSSVEMLLSMIHLMVSVSLYKYLGSCSTDREANLGMPDPTLKPPPSGLW